MKTTDAYTLGNELRELGLIKSHNQISLHQWKYKFESEGLSGFIDLKGKGPKPPKKRRVKNEDK